MNRRGFISLIAGAGGALVVPWRQLTDPVIVLPPRPRLIVPPLHWNLPRGVPPGTQIMVYADDPLDPRIASAVYIGERTGWHYLGGSWMTPRDRQDFEDVMSGRLNRITREDAIEPRLISLVTLHRRRV